VAVGRWVDAGHSSLCTPGFVGRLAELDQLTRAMANRPALVLVAGEAGIGKTRLVTEWLGSAGNDQRAVVTACPPFHRPYTLGPIVDAVRQATDGLRGLRLSNLAGALRPLFRSGRPTCRRIRRRSTTSPRRATGSSAPGTNC
jgi:hypothetical protein